MVDANDVHPFEIDLLLWAHDGPRWEVASFVNREGWLMIATAQRHSPIGDMRATLAVALTDQGEPLPYILADRLLELPTSLPRDADGIPPEALVEAMEARYWDFLGRTDRELLIELAEAQERCDRRIAAFEAECAAFEAKVWTAIRALRTERRGIDLTTVRRNEIDARLDRLLAMPDELATGAREKTRAMRAEHDDFEALVFDFLGEEGELAIVSIARWRGRTGRRADPWAYDGLRGGLPANTDRRDEIGRLRVAGKAAHVNVVARFAREIKRRRKIDPTGTDPLIDALEREQQRLLRLMPMHGVAGDDRSEEQDAM